MSYRYREVDKISVYFCLNYWDKAALSPLRFFFFLIVNIVVSEGVIVYHKDLETVCIFIWTVFAVNKTMLSTVFMFYK